MPIPPLPENVSFDPEQIKTITSAYEKALQELRLMDADPRTEALAKQIIAGAQNGEHNPDRLCAFALRALSTS